jgi:hypothetical protein
MKKYLFGLTAILFALGIVAFKNPEMIGKKTTTYEFYYTAPGSSYDDLDVKDNTLWDVTSISCNGTNTKACNMRVQESYTKLVNSVRKLRISSDGAPFLAIQTQASGTVKYVVTTTGVDNIINKSN